MTELTPKTSQEIEAMREGGAHLVGIFKKIQAQLVPGTNLIDLDKLFREAAKSVGAEPSFLGHEGYPAAICASVNNQIVHCPPTDYQLKEGDIITIDGGLYFKNFHTDSAFTAIIGQDIHNYTPLLRATYQALLAGTQVVRADVRVGEISQAISDSVVQSGFEVMKQFVGHGIGRKLHEAPVVPNFVGHDKDVVLPAGTTIAIEPIVGAGRDGHILGPDGWSTTTVDDSPAAHFEHTVVVTPEGAEVLTPLDDIIRGQA